VQASNNLLRCWKGGREAAPKGEPGGMDGERRSLHGHSWVLRAGIKEIMAVDSHGSVK